MRRKKTPKLTLTSVTIRSLATGGADEPTQGYLTCQPSQGISCVCSFEIAACN